MSYESLLDILRCPACASERGSDPGQLELIADKWLICQDCDRKYPIRGQTPVMLIQEGDRHRNTPIEALDEP